MALCSSNFEPCGIGELVHWLINQYLCHSKSHPKMNPYVYVISVNGLMFLISVIFYFFPPKKINSLYGYRTHRTMQNEDVWNFANTLFNKILLKYASISFVAALALAYLYPNLMTSWFPMGFLFFTLLVCIIATENALNQHFDKEGNRISKR